MVQVDLFESRASFRVIFATWNHNLKYIFTLAMELAVRSIHDRWREVKATSPVNHTHLSDDPPAPPINALFYKDVAYYLTRPPLTLCIGDFSCSQGSMVGEAGSSFRLHSVIHCPLFSLLHAAYETFTTNLLIHLHEDWMVAVIEHWTEKLVSIWRRW